MMNRALLALLAICALTAAMVPRHRRAIDQDERQERSENPPENPSENLAENATGHILCNSVTPCAWTIYNPFIKVIDQHINNSYCICGPGQRCQEDEDDPTANAFIYRCRTVLVPSQS